MTTMMEKEKKAEETDRLSALPDALLIHILGFLDTKDAVQASLSLKKWVNLWTLLADLDFDSSVFKKRSSFDKFVDKVLTLRDHSVKINKFSYSRRGKMKPKLMERITGYAVRHDVQYLTISAGRFINYNFIDQLGSIKSFELSGNAEKYWGKSFCLEQLVTLHLQSFALIGTENFSGCPNLTNLSLSGCAFFPSLKRLDGPSISAPKLSVLIISGCSYAPKITLFTPKLISFKFEGSGPFYLETDELTLLETVDMDFFFHNDDPRKLIALLKCFSNAKSIRLSSSIVELLSSYPDKLAREPSPFSNLKVLTVVPRKTFSITIPGHVTAFLMGSSPAANTVIELPSCGKCSK